MSLPPETSAQCLFLLSKRHLDNLCIGTELRMHRQLARYTCAMLQVNHTANLDGFMDLHACASRKLLLSITVLPVDNASDRVYSPLEQWCSSTCSAAKPSDCSLSHLYLACKQGLLTQLVQIFSGGPLLSAGPSRIVIEGIVQHTHHGQLSLEISRVYVLPKHSASPPQSFHLCYPITNEPM